MRLPCLGLTEPIKGRDPELQSPESGWGRRDPKPEVHAPDGRIVPVAGSTADEPCSTTERPASTTCSAVSGVSVPGEARAKAPQPCMSCAYISRPILPQPLSRTAPLSWTWLAEWVTKAGCAPTGRWRRPGTGRCPTAPDRKKRGSGLKGQPRILPIEPGVIRPSDFTRSTGLFNRLARCARARSLLCFSTEDIIMPRGQSSSPGFSLNAAELCGAQILSPRRRRHLSQ